MAFQLFHKFDKVGGLADAPSASNLYALLERFRDAVREGVANWAAYPAMREYADVCFWAIRKLEYTFAAETFASLEAGAAQPLRVLDVGCGVVPLCNWMSTRGHDVTAVDPSQADMDVLTQCDLNAFYASRVEYKVGRAEQLRFPSATFDVVTCISVLEHIPPGNDRLSLWEIARVLKPNGHLILTFDVAPPPILQVGESGWPTELRQHGRPFSPTSIARLFTRIRTDFDGLDEPLPIELQHLTWDEVHAFWRAGQTHDARIEAEREYLAIGGVLTRGSQVARVPEEETVAAYVEGQAALEERLGFFQLHAQQRLELINRLDAEGEVLQRQLTQKEQLIHDLDSQAGERLELLEHLQERPALMAPDEHAQVRLEAVEKLLTRHETSLDELSARMDRFRATLDLHTNLVRQAISNPSLQAARDSEMLGAILAWREDLERMLAAHSERLLAAALPVDARTAEEQIRVLKREKDAAEAIAEARLSVIEDQKRLIANYQRWRFGYRVNAFFAPRIGVLYHYEPRELIIPSRYSRIDPPAPAPKVSIVTPTLNQGRFLERTLRAVLGQKYPELEYIVQDGASTDETHDVLDKYRDSLARIVSEPDDGLGCAINRGMRAAGGDILAYLNSDDVLLPGTLNYVASYFAKHRDVDVVYGHRVLIDEYDREIGRWVLPPHDNDVLSWADYIPQETLFWRRAIWETIGASVDESFKFAVDWDLLLRFRDAGAKMRRLPRFLAAFRVHPNQKTTSEMREIGHREMERLRERALGRSVTTAEITKALAPYLRRHFIHHKLYRLGILRY